jgi:lysozyme family protein
MSNWELIVPHVLKWEGGLGADPNDAAIKNPANNSGILMKTGNWKGYPIHTNKGIIFSTWQAHCKKFGFDCSGTGFVNMTNAQWAKIVELIFWKGASLEKINSQSIAELFFETYWGSGGGGLQWLVKQTQIYLNKLQVAKLVEDGKIGVNTISAINKFCEKKQDEKMLYDFLWFKRLAFYKSLKDWSNFGNGWNNRMIALYERAKSFFGTHLTVSIGLIVIIGVLAFVGFKQYTKAL